MKNGPASVLYDATLDKPVTVADGDANVAGQPLLPIAGTDGANQKQLQTDAAGNLKVVAGTAGTGTITRVASSAASVTVLALNAARIGAVIVNDSTKILYLKFGTTATSTDFTYKMLPGDTMEIPFGYTGRIDGIWAAANGAAQVTELT